MFVYQGHIRHFFSHGYIRKLLRDGWKIENLESGQEDLYGHTSAFIQVIAQKLASKGDV